MSITSTSPQEKGFAKGTSFEKKSKAIPLSQWAQHRKNLDQEIEAKLDKELDGIQNTTAKKVVPKIEGPKKKHNRIRIPKSVTSCQEVIRKLAAEMHIIRDENSRLIKENRAWQLKLEKMRKSIESLWNQFNVS